MKKFLILIVIFLLLFTGCDKKTPGDNISPEVVTGGVSMEPSTEPSAPVTVSPEASPDVSPDASPDVSPENTGVDTVTPPDGKNGEIDAPGFIDDLFSALKSGDTDTVDAHMSYSEISSFVNESLMLYSERQKLVDEVFRRLSWSVTAARKGGTGESYGIHCEITNVNMVDAVSQFMVDGNRLVSGNEALPDGERLSGEQINERLSGMLVTSIKATDTFVTENIGFSLSLVDGVWRVELNDDLLAALTGGFVEAVQQSGFSIYD